MVDLSGCMFVILVAPGLGGIFAMREALVYSGRLLGGTILYITSLQPTFKKCMRFIGIAAVLRVGVVLD